MVHAPVWFPLSLSMRNTSYSLELNFIYEVNFSLRIHQISFWVESQINKTHADLYKKCFRLQTYKYPLLFQELQKFPTINTHQEI